MRNLEVLMASNEGLTRAVEILSRGGIVAHGTETCYGFACDLTSPEAVTRLFALKRRPPNQPVSVLFASVEEAKKYVKWNDRAEELAKKYLPGPLTLVLPLKKVLPHNIWTRPRQGTGGRGQGASPVLGPRSSVRTFGIRVSSYPIASELARRFGKPLSTTSANVHGGSNPYSAEDILGQFPADCLPKLAGCTSLIVLDSGPLPEVPPSTIVDLTQDGRIRRRGALHP